MGDRYLALTDLVETPDADVSNVSAITNGTAGTDVADGADVVAEPA